MPDIQPYEHFGVAPLVLAIVILALCILFWFTRNE